MSIALLIISLTLMALGPQPVCIPRLENTCTSQCSIERVPVLIPSSSPPDDPLWSRYTLLVYLNSDIPTDTGCTTFFLPSKETGVLEATSVRPVQGAVLCFRA